MVKTILSTTQSDSNAGTTTAGATQYWFLGYAPSEPNSTESTREITHRTAGTLSKLYVRVTANTTSTNSTVTIRKNAGDTTLTTTITAGTPGVYENTANSVTIAAGDKLCIKTVSGGTGTFTFSIISTIFDATTDCSTRLVSKGYGVATASVTHFIAVAGDRSGTTATEAASENTIKTAGTAKNAFINVTANARTTNTTFTLRKNRANTAITFTYTSGETGIKEDTSNSISYAVDDEIDWAIVTSTGTQTLTFQCAAIDYVTTTNNGVLTTGVVGTTSDIVMGEPLTWFFPIGGGMRQALTTEADTQMKAREAFTFKNLIVYVGANTINATSTFGLRVNGADAISQNITTTQTGFIANTTDTVTVAEGDLINFAITTPAVSGSQTMTIRQMSITTELAALTRVENDLIVKYNIVARVTNDFIAKYNITGRVTNDLVAKYNIVQRITNDLITKYNIVQRVTNDLIAKYNIMGRVTSDLIVKYNILERIVNSLIVKYTIFQRVSRPAPKSLMVNSRGNFSSTGITTAGATQYWKCASTALVANNSEAIQEIPWYTPGTISKLYCRVIANSTSVDSTLVLRKNRADTTMTVTIPAGTIGVFEDTTHDIAVAAGDELTFQTISGGTGTFTMAMIAVGFDAGNNEKAISKFSGYGHSFSTASVTNYNSISGSRSAGATTEANAESIVKVAGTIRNAYFFVNSNARSTTSTVTLRKNNADTAIVFTINAGTSGVFENTTDSVSCAVDDRINWEMVNGSGTGTLSVSNYCFDYETPSNGLISAGATGSGGDITPNANVTEYYVVGGANIEGTATEADAQMKAGRGYKLSNLTVYVRVNTVTADTTVRLRINGANGNSVVTIGSGVTGFITDTVNTDTVGANDLIDYQIITGATGTVITISQIAIYTQAVETVLPSLIVKYNIYERVTNDLIAKYNILGRVVNSLIVKYNIMGRVTNDLIAKYNILQRVVNNLIVKYSITGRVSNDLIIKYDIIGRIVQDLIVKYNITGRVTNDLIAKYSITGRTTNDLIVKYDIIQRVTADLILKYNILNRVVNDLIVKYDILGITLTRVENDLIVKYNITGRVANDLIVKYNIRQRIVNDLIAKYNIDQRVTNDLIIKYNIIQRVVNSLIVRYNIIQRVTNDLIVKYDIISVVLERVVADLVVKYNIHNRVTNDLIVKYAIKVVEVPLSLIRGNRWRSIVRRTNDTKTEAINEDEYENKAIQYLKNKNSWVRKLF